MKNNNEEIKCPKCNKYFEPNKEKKYFKQSKGFFIKCPNCHIKLTNLKQSQAYYKKDNGQLINRLKSKLNKKERLKRQKLEKDFIKNN